MADDRVILHADMNAYFASVEELYSPELRDVPMAICGDPKSRRGIILAKNERAKRFGVKTAETIFQAQRKCPGLVLRPPRRHDYSRFCDMANAIYGQYTDLVEPASIDESYLDVTGSLHLFGGEALQLAHEIRMRITEELGLTISVGVSFNKIFAKMASDMKKPDAVTCVSREDYRRMLWPLPASAMLMVGKTTEAALQAIGIHTVGDLARADVALMEGRLGKHGAYLHMAANGEDTSPVLPQGAEVKNQSVGNGITFKRNLTARDEILTAIHALSDSVASRLRSEGQKCRVVQVTIKDVQLAVITRQMGLSVPTWLSSEIADAAMHLIDTKWPRGKPIRLLTVTAMKLVPPDQAVEQVSLFGADQVDARRKKDEQLAKALDTIREKYGRGIIKSASIVRNDLGIDEYASDNESADSAE